MAIKVKTMQDNIGKPGVYEIGLGQSRLGTPPVGHFLTSFVCHDLRHPLTAILGQSRLLAEGELNGL